MYFCYRTPAPLVPGPNGPNQNMSRIQNKPKHSLPPVVCAGPVVWDSTYYGETYDARLEQKGWSQAR